MPRFKRLCLSIAGTASVALASLPLAIGPVSAARVPVGITTSIGVMEASSNASQFNLGSQRAQGSSTELVGQTKNLQWTPVIPRPRESAGGKTSGINGGTVSGTVFAAGNGGRDGKPVGGNNGCGGGNEPIIPAGKPIATNNSDQKTKKYPITSIIISLPPNPDASSHKQISDPTNHGGPDLKKSYTCQAPATTGAF